MVQPEPRNGINERLQDVAFLAKVLSDENRLRILLHLGSGKRSVSQIAEAMNLSQPLVSHHLRELKRALLVGVERRGPFVYYALADPAVLATLAGLNELAASLLASRNGF